MSGPREALKLTRRDDDRASAARVALRVLCVGPRRVACLAKLGLFGCADLCIASWYAAMLAAVGSMELADPTVWFMGRLDKILASQYFGPPVLA